MNQIPNIEEVDNTIKIGYDPASPDGDKSRVVLRFPDGQLKAFIPEDEYHQQLQKAREEAIAIYKPYVELVANIAKYGGKEHLVKVAKALTPELDHSELDQDKREQHVTTKK